VRTMEYRKSAHEQAINSSPQLPFHRALKKYGLKAFEWSILEENELPWMLFLLERFWIKRLKSRSPGGYNLSDGGEGNPGWVPTEEWKEKKRQEQLGRSRSKETRDKLRKANLGKRASLETRIKLSIVRKGKRKKPHTAETKAKISKAKTGIRLGPKSPETIQRMCEARRKWCQTDAGKVHMERMRKLSSVYQKLHPHSEEQRRKQSESLRDTWANPEKKVAWLEARKKTRLQKQFTSSEKEK